MVKWGEVRWDEVRVTWGEMMLNEGWSDGVR